MHIKVNSSFVFMEKLFTSDFKLGIIAGGQLAKMLIQEASKWDINTYVLDDDENCPASKIATQFIKGNRLDFQAVYEFGKMVDVLTFEIESINAEALKKLKSEGITINPDPEILELIQDKGLQKDFFKQHNIPSPFYKICDCKEHIYKLIEDGELKFPFVQKLRKGGYDGRGVTIINNKNEITKLLSGSSVVEEKVDIAKEISIIVARNKKGEKRSFPVVELIFDSRANLVDMLLCPSSITKEQNDSVISIAHKLIDLLKLEGLLAIEFFIDTQGRVLVNEISPRPHNSGHHTIESTYTSQFEQHLRAILNLPLGSTQLKHPSVMINILGSENYEGVVKYIGLSECLAIEGVNIHLYGKKITKPFRKMGHITIVSNDLETAIEKANKVKQLIKAISWQPN